MFPLILHFKLNGVLHIWWNRKSKMKNEVRMEKIRKCYGLTSVPNRTSNKVKHPSIVS